MKARKEEKRFMETKKVELAKGYYAKINLQTNGNTELQFHQPNEQKDYCYLLRSKNPCKLR